MPLVAAICTQCGSKLEVDSGKEAAICPYCKTAFITEKAINNYNTTNVTNIGKLHADVLNMTDDSSRDSRVRSGETFIKLNDYAAAYKVFNELTMDCPYDYRGWWGLIRVKSLDFSDLMIDREKLSSIEQLYKKTCTVASPDEQKAVAPQYEAYYRAVRDKRAVLLSESQARIRELEMEFKRYKRDKEEQIKRSSEQLKKLDKRSNIGCAFWGVLYVALAVWLIKEVGFLGGLVMSFIPGAILYGIALLVEKVMSLLFNNNREKYADLSWNINKLKKQLEDSEKEHRREMDRLNEIIRKVK